MIRSGAATAESAAYRSEEHTSELQSRSDLVCRLLLEKKKNIVAEGTSLEIVSIFSSELPQRTHSGASYPLGPRTARSAYRSCHRRLMTSWTSRWTRRA